MRACPCRVSAHCSTALHMLFFWLKSASTFLRAPLPAPLTVLARVGALASFLSRADGNSLPGLLLDSLSSPQACLPVVATREKTPRLDPGVGDCGSRVCAEPSASPSQWSEIASEGAVFLCNLDCDLGVALKRRPAVSWPLSLSL